MLPFVYVLQGFNIIHTEEHTIKFFIEFTSQAGEEKEEKIADKRRFCELRLQDIWNLGPIIQSHPAFDIKIVCQGNIFRIPFSTQLV